MESVKEKVFGAVSVGALLAIFVLEWYTLFPAWIVVTVLLRSLLFAEQSATLRSAVGVIAAVFLLREIGNYRADARQEALVRKIEAHCSAHFAFVSEPPCLYIMADIEDHKSPEEFPDYSDYD